MRLTLLQISTFFCVCFTLEARLASRQSCAASGRLYVAGKPYCEDALKSTRYCRFNDDKSIKYWIVKDKKTGDGICVEKCVPSASLECKMKARRNHHSTCRPTQDLFYTEYGDTICDCKDNYIETEPGVCYPLYQKGPCKQGEYLTWNDNDPKCVLNSCGEGQAYLDISKLFGQVQPIYSCLNLQSKLCNGNEIRFDEETLQPTCTRRLSPNSAFHIVLLQGCPPGHVRKRDKTCDKPTRP